MEFAANNGLPAEVPKNGKQFNLLKFMGQSQNLDQICLQEQILQLSNKKEGRASQGAILNPSKG